ncbi:MAG: hypothetical protein AAGL09_18475 [Pseudomonadota bacterium]
MGELIKRLRETDLGSRELDLEIERLIYARDYRWVDPEKPHSGITYDKYEPGAVGNPVYWLPEYTNSLDDAIELTMSVLPESKLKIEFDRTSFGEHIGWEARISADYKTPWFSASHPFQPSIALIMAMLPIAESRGEIATHPKTREEWECLSG